MTAFPYHLRAVSSLVANPKNARTHSKKQIDKIAKSIKEFGFINPIVIDGDGVLIAGHGRLEAAKKLGLEEVPAILARHLNEKQKRLYMLADNRMAMDAGWDEDILRVELRDLAAMIPDLDIDLTGFNTDEFSALVADKDKNDEAENEIPDTPADPVSQLGDTWLLGPHRVRCGDSTNAEDVAALLGDAKPHLLVSDPPYGVEYDANWRNEADRANGKPSGARARGKVSNDARADWREAWALFPGDVIYIWHAGLRAREVYESIEAVGFKIRSQIIWAKNQLVIGRGDYHQKHEPCCYAVRAGKKAHWNGSRKETTVWDIDKPQKSETGHSTQKPVECMRRPILNNSKHGDVVYDPFLGSSTTIIAAETEGRVCYGMELNPAYVDLGVRRWEQFTGREAVLESTGQPFAKVAKTRQKALKSA